jgi:enoyl-CoA hydratase
MTDSILVQERGSILEVTLNRPDKLNALDDKMLRALHEAITLFAESSNLRVLLLRANGRFFCAGGDLNGNIFPDMPEASPAAYRHWLQTADASFAALTAQIEQLQKPTVVAHQGPCVGAGLEVSLAFDFRLAAPTQGP